MKKFSLKRISVAVVIMYVILTVALIAAILFLGGISLLGYLKTTLIQGLGLGLAATASLFFFLRLVWRLHAVPMVWAMGFFVFGVAMFTSASVGRMYALQYPIFVNSFGPGHGPGLPIKNVLTFFRHVGQFEVIPDISRNPNDVPPSRVAPTAVAESEATGLDGAEPIMLGDTLVPIDAETAPDTGNKTVAVYLETTEVLSEIAPGITYNYWTFNNTVPGPMMRVTEGDIVEVTIHNKVTSLHHHNIDFHAATGPGGGGAVSVVNPGETKTFRFKAMNPGLFVYHCAVPNMAVHMAHGMYGLVLVEPKEGLPPVDKEFYVMQGELYTTGTLGRTGLQIFDAQKMMDGVPEYVTFNGRPGGLAAHMQAQVGDRIRMYVGNGGVAHNSSFHIVGEIFDTVYPEASIGGAQFHNVQTTNVPAGGATIVEFTVDYPGDYVLVDHALMRTDKGAWGTLTVSGEADPTIFDGEVGTHDHAAH